MPRLRRVDCSAPGLTRRRRGTGWVYVDAGGQPVTDPTTLARIEQLVIPPAWSDVWICPVASGHIQATGTDAKGRRQYRYHDEWRRQRDLAKHERVLDLATVLPRVREQVAAELALPGMPRERALAAALRLLDLGFFRIGSEEYAEANETYGLATIRRDHVTVRRDGEVVFDYIAKSGKHRVQSVRDDAVAEVVRLLKRRRGGGDELLAYRGPRGDWVDVKAGDVNDHLRELSGLPVSAKDFRTWHATVLAAVGLAVTALGHGEPGGALPPTTRKRAVTRVVQEVADKLGNTPAVCRSSYIDPRVVDLFDSGTTIAPVLDRLAESSEYGTPATQGAVEAAVLALLREEPEEQRRAG